MSRPRRLPGPEWADDWEDGVAGFQRAYAWSDLAIDGAWGPETARAAQRVVDTGGLLSRYVHLDDVRSKGNGRLRSQRDLLRGLDELFDIIGGKERIWSMYRDLAHNARVGGASSSRHIYGEACDVVVPSWAAESIAAFQGRGYDDRRRVVAHVDLGPPRTWDYDAGRMVQLLERVTFFVTEGPIERCPIGEAA